MEYDSRNALVFSHTSACLIYGSIVEAFRVLYGEVNRRLMFSHDCLVQNYVGSY